MISNVFYTMARMMTREIFCAAATTKIQPLVEKVLNRFYCWSLFFHALRRYTVDTERNSALSGARKEQCIENHVADQIRFYRRQEGLTQEQLAEAMGVSVAAVSKWEQGQSLPEIPMLMELADFFDLSVDALLGYRLRSNDRKSISERLKVLRREDRYDEGLAEAEKALQKFPNTFTVVYECAKLFEMAGGTRKDKALQRRALDLLTHAIRLLPQNSDPQVSEMSLRLDMANVLLDMEDWERALALFKENNACGLLDDQIGCLLALVKERREEGVPYLSMALLRAVTSLVRVCDGFANVFEARKDMKSAIDILQWKHSVLSGLRKKGTVSELDKISAASHAALARLLYDCRDLGGANDELKTAKALGTAYDAAPSHSARNVRFYEGVEHVGIYSDFGRSAMDAALDAFLGDDSTEKLEAFFRNG